MSSFETEDEQVEDLKRWWKENGKAVIVGVVLGFSAILGTRMYLNHLETQRYEASIAYEGMNMARQQQPEVMFTRGEQIVEKYPDTPYAAMASLALAKFHVDKGELAAARNRLQWVIEHESQPDIVHVARQNLARVLLAEGQADQALALLTDIEMEAYMPVYQELRGDIYVSKQQPKLARTAYEAALEMLDANDDRQILLMKLDDLGD